jgi:tRNA(Ile)-lysidine synthase
MCAASSLAERVAGYVAEHALLEPGEPVVALVSGGADSLCLWGLLRELGHPVDALHVEHGLRGEAGLADAAFCAGLGATVVPVDIAGGPNVEARARDARYAAARAHAAGRALATGHTITDQAETVLYRMASSSGVRALRGMRPRAGDLARPLLCVSAAETRAWCAAAGLEPRVDASNADPAHRRNMIRHQVLPILERVHPGAVANLARSAELLADADELLAGLAGPHVAAELDLGMLATLPPGLAAIVLRESADRAAGRPLRLSRALTERLAQVASRRSGEERLSLARDVDAVRVGGVLSFAAPRGRYSAPG